MRFPKTRALAIVPALAFPLSLAACSPGSGDPLATPSQSGAMTLSQDGFQRLVAESARARRNGTALAMSEGAQAFGRDLCRAGTLAFADWKGRVDDVLPEGGEAARIVVLLKKQATLATPADAAVPRRDPLFARLAALRPGTNLRLSGTLLAGPDGCPRVAFEGGNPVLAFRLAGFTVGR